MLETKTNKLLEKLVNLLTHFVIPICEDDEHGRPYVFGSGLLVNIYNEYFVITAGHVLDPLRENRKLYFYFDENSGTVFTTLAPGGIRKDDKLDIGVVLLPREARPPFRAGNKIALPWESLRPSLHPRDLDSPQASRRLSEVSIRFCHDPKLIMAHRLRYSSLSKWASTPEFTWRCRIRKKYLMRVVGVSSRQIHMA